NTKSSAQQLARMDLIEQEKNRDALLKGHTDTLTTWYGKLAELKARGMTDEHPDVKAARDNIATAQRAIVDREAEIAAVVSKRFEERVRFESGKTVEEAKQKMDEATAQLANFNGEM